MDHCEVLIISFVFADKGELETKTEMKENRALQAHQQVPKHTTANSTKAAVTTCMQANFELPLHPHPGNTRACAVHDDASACKAGLSAVQPGAQVAEAPDGRVQRWHAILHISSGVLQPPYCWSGSAAPPTGMVCLDVPHPLILDTQTWKI